MAHQNRSKQISLLLTIFCCTQLSNSASVSSPAIFLGDGLSVKTTKVVQLPNKSTKAPEIENVYPVKNSFFVPTDVSVQGKVTESGEPLHMITQVRLTGSAFWEPEMDVKNITDDDEGMFDFPIQLSTVKNDGNQFIKAEKFKIPEKVAN